MKRAKTIILLLMGLFITIGAGYGLAETQTAQRPGLRYIAARTSMLIWPSSIAATTRVFWTISPTSSR